MTDIKQVSDQAVAQTDNKKVPTSTHRQSPFGHALDGSQQLDILEEQIYTNTDGPAKDQPIVPAKIAGK
ncbi:hypothetical protein ACVBEF_20420 [Glaciimonas sp. GG7]